MRRQGLRQGKGSRRPPPGPPGTQGGRGHRGSAQLPTVQTLDVLDLAGKGDGVCRLADGAVVLVPGAVPGDRVEVALEPARAGVRRGRILALLAPSPARREPPCPVADRCGGCTWLHISLERQRVTKAELARRALAVLAAGDGAPSDGPAEALAPLVPPMRGETPLVGWRRRARLHVRRQGDTLAIGLLAAQSDALVAIASCPQLAPPLAAWLPRWRRDLAPWLVRGEVSATLGREGLVVRVHGVAAPDGPHAGGDVEAGWLALARDWMDRPVAAGAPIVGVHATLGALDVALGASAVWLADDGDDGEEAWSGAFASAAGFSQASRHGNAGIRAAVRGALEALVARNGGPFAFGEELYAGSGNLTPLLANAAGAVRTVEFDADAVARAEAARPRWLPGPASLADATLRVGDAGSAALAGGDDVVWLLDPGRPGAAEVMARAAALRPAGLVYVSCAPDTLRRDLAILAAAGWRAVTSCWVDTMPATPHLEVVVAVVPPRLDADLARC